MPSSFPLRLATTIVLITAVSVPASAQGSQERSGFWFNFGLGTGSLGCDGCVDRLSGLSGQIGVGGTLSSKVTLGVMSNGWYKSEDGVSLNVGTLTAAIRFYPKTTSGFFLTAGLGLGSMKLDIDGFGSDTETGTGAMVGLGWDFRIGNNISITPFWNGFAVKVNDGDANVGQLGVGITVH